MRRLIARLLIPVTFALCAAIGYLVPTLLAGR